MAGHHPRVKRETKYEYTDKVSGKKRTFHPVEDEVVATFDREDTQEVGMALRSRAESALSAFSPTDGYAIVRVPDASSTRSADALEAQERIANALPVMLDDEGGRRYFLPDEFTVQFSDHISDAEAHTILAGRSMPVIAKQRTPGYYTVGVPEGKGLFQAIGEMSKMSEVTFAEPSEIGLDDLLEPTASPTKTEAPKVGEADDADGDGLVDMAEVIEDMHFAEEGFLPQPDTSEREAEPDLEAHPSDAFFGRLWGLHNVGQSVNGTTGTTDADIDAPQAWTQSVGTRRVVIAVLDTGCDLDHPDLKGNILPRGNEDWDFADPNDEEPWDSQSHGTHVAGTIGARRNAEGIVGVAYGAWLMPLRLNLTSGKNQNRADAINYVTNQARRYRHSRRYVINCSWRMSGDHTGVRLAIQNAVANNVVVVFAAGNANRNIDDTPQYPAVYPEVIAVAATDQRDQRAWFSNYGKKVDVAAPGVNIYSTVPNDTYGFKDGTSMAAPHVAGVAALIWSKNADLTNHQVRACIEKTCDNIDAKNAGFEGLLGRGRVNAYRAVLHTPPPRLRTQVLRKYPFPQRNAGSSTGLSFVPRFPIPFWGSRPVLLFLTQQAGSERVHFIDPTFGIVLRTIDPVANDTIGSMSWDGAAIRVANVTTGAGSINQINPFNGSQIGSIPAPAGRGEGLAVIGSRIFYSTISHIHELRASTGQVLRSFPAPGGRCRGLAYGHRYLFSAESVSGKITVFNPWTMHVRGTIDAPGSGTRQAEGIAFDPLRRILYIANQSENQIYALRVLGL